MANYEYRNDTLNGVCIQIFKDPAGKHDAILGMAVMDGDGPDDRLSRTRFNWILEDLGICKAVMADEPNVTREPWQIEAVAALLSDYLPPVRA